jgi:hypothetical protein
MKLPIKQHQAQTDGRDYTRGSRLGSHNSSGFIGEARFWPVQNVEQSAAYTADTKFNGASQNYDGLGRDAPANNSVYGA